MAATMYISESNGTVPTVTMNVTSLNFGYSLTTDADLTNLTANLYPIPAATSLGRSFEKWVRFNMSTLGGSTYCYNFKVYNSSSMGAGGCCTVSRRGGGMLETIQNTREVVIRHIMGQVFVSEVSVDAGMRLIAAFQEEYQVAKDSAERYQRACYQITNDKIVVMGGEKT